MKRATRTTHLAMGMLVGTLTAVGQVHAVESDDPIKLTLHD